MLNINLLGKLTKFDKSGETSSLIKFFLKWNTSNYGIKKQCINKFSVIWRVTSDYTKLSKRT